MQTHEREILFRALTLSGAPTPSRPNTRRAPRLFRRLRDHLRGREMSFHRLFERASHAYGTVVATDGARTEIVDDMGLFAFSVDRPMPLGSRVAYVRQGGAFTIVEE